MSVEAEKKTARILASSKWVMEATLKDTYRIFGIKENPMPCAIWEN